MGAFCFLFVIIAVVFMICEELFSDFKYSSFLFKERRKREKKIKRFEDLPEEEQQKIRDFEFRERIREKFTYDIYKCDFPSWLGEQSIKKPPWKNDNIIERKRMIKDLENFKSQFLDLPFFALVIPHCSFPRFGSWYLNDIEIRNSIYDYTGLVDFDSVYFENHPCNPIRDRFSIYREIKVKAICEKYGKKFDYDLFDRSEFYKKSKYIDVHLINKQKDYKTFSYVELEDDESRNAFLDTYSKIFSYIEEMEKDIGGGKIDTEGLEYIWQYDVFVFNEQHNGM